VVVHYAGEVAYNVVGFLEKNKDALPPDLEELGKQSSIPFVQNLFKKVFYDDIEMVFVKIYYNTLCINALVFTSLFCVLIVFVVAVFALCNCSPLTMVPIKIKALRLLVVSDYLVEQLPRKWE
jgi:hypothetical protein